MTLSVRHLLYHRCNSCCKQLCAFEPALLVAMVMLLSERGPAESRSPALCCASTVLLRPLPSTAPVSRAGRAVAVTHPAPTAAGDTADLNTMAVALLVLTPRYSQQVPLPLFVHCCSFVCKGSLALLLHRHLKLGSC